MNFMTIYMIYETYERQDLLPRHTMALWRALLFIAANRERLHFTLVNLDLMKEAGLKKDLFFAARKELEEKGFLLVESVRGSRYAAYTLLDGTSRKTTKAVGKPVAQPVGKPVDEMGVEMQVKTDVPTDQVVDKPVCEPVDKPVDLSSSHASYTHTGEKDFDLTSLKAFKTKDQNLATTTRCAAILAHAEIVGFRLISGRMAHGLEEWLMRNTFPESLLMAKRALDLASDANVLNWNYVHTLLKAWEKKRFTTVAETIKERKSGLNKVRVKRKNKQLNRKGIKTMNLAKEHFSNTIHLQTSEDNVVSRYMCEGCDQDVTVYNVEAYQGPNKGTFRPIPHGCKCEDLELGRLVLKRQREILAKQRKELFDLHSLVNSDLLKATLDSYEPKTEQQTLALQVCRHYASTFSMDEPRNLLFVGDCGVGKSHLAMGIMKRLLRKQLNGIFITVPQLLTHLKHTFNNKKVSEYELIQRLKDVDCLVLDDIGAEYNRNDGESWAVSKVFELIDARLGKPMIYTTNLSSRQLYDRLGKRNHSRLLYNTKLIRVDGVDFRANDFNRRNADEKGND
ncbi:ATP-binding protein [Bacillus sp. JCM 19041]|uniref:ATP-binding protein n=1 Tax=Bacillus sp. JCM 19041 TaxID=1460637 RepID=UPI0006CF238C